MCGRKGLDIDTVMMNIDKHTSSGRIIVDPNRGSMKRKTEWWSIVSVDREITRYYRALVKTEHDIELIQPAWNAHVSIVRGEKPSHKFTKRWKESNNTRVTFEYEHNPRRSTIVNRAGEYFWFVDVYCEELNEIRKSLGLQTKFKYHLTFGKERG